MYPFFFLLASLFSSPQGAAEQYTLTVNVQNIPINQGHVLLILFKGEDGFPSDPKKAFAYDGKKVENSQAVIVFKNLPPGSYAIAALHDENSNGQMDTNLVGLPKEGYGASNDANNPFGPPRYKDAKFEMTGDRSMTINIRKLFQ